MKGTSKYASRDTNVKSRSAGASLAGVSAFLVEVLWVAVPYKIFRDEASFSGVKYPTLNLS